MNSSFQPLFATLAAAAVLSIAVSQTFAQNIVLNPGFEAGTTGDADDWEELTGPAGSTTRSSVMPHSGSFSAYMEVDHVNNPPAAAPYFIQQVQPVDLRHADIGHDGVRPTLRKALQHAGSALEARDLHALLKQGFLEHPADRTVVVDDPHFAHGIVL